MGREAQPNHKPLTDHLPELAIFRRALRRVDWEAYGRIMKKGERHADSISSFPDPTTAVFLAILIENEKAIQALKREMILRGYVEEGMKD